MIRQTLRPDYYNVTRGLGHSDHCIDSIRQSLMCSADVTPIVWAWDEKSHRSSHRTDTLHSCRNFEKIQEWAKDNQVDGELVENVRVEDDLD
jgi:hypothetical protein